MKQAYFGLLRHTVRELLYSKSLYFIGAATTLTALLLIFVGRFAGLSALHNSPEIVDSMGRNSLIPFASIVTFFSLFGAGGIIPGLISPGTISFFAARPYSRVALLTCKLVGINIAVAIVMLGSVGLLIFLDAIMGSSGMSISAALLQLTLEYLVFVVYSPLLVLFGLLFRSSALSVMGCFAVWLLTNILLARATFQTFFDRPLVNWLIDAVYTALPKSGEISKIGITGHYDWAPLWTSALFALVIFAVALWKFRRADF